MPSVRINGFTCADSDHKAERAVCHYLQMNVAEDVKGILGIFRSSYQGGMTKGQTIYTLSHQSAFSASALWNET